MAQIPVIFLAFANDRQNDAAYLRNLPQELHGIREALQRGVDAGLCEVVERSNLSIEQLLDVFQDARYRGRIAVFHYGGHANGYQLLLESESGQHASAHSEGLVSFLAKQASLQLVFLNGCSSQQQALELLEAGIPAVVGTAQSINDDIATALAIRFYKGLGAGSSISQAWQEAADEMRMRTGNANMRDLYWEEASEPEEGRFPWEIHFREASKLVKGWNLPEAAQNPLFGLPEIPPKYPLPDKPFVFFRRYTREHAPLFFGRGNYIRQLFQLCHHADAPPIILFYGQSGTGKSSLLEAGLLPRLEESHLSICVRRDASLGLVGTAMQALRQLLGETHTPADRLKEELQQAIAQLQELAKAFPAAAPEAMASVQKLEARIQNMQTTSSDTLEGLWRRVEASCGKPLLLMLDQVEEAITYPNASLPNELEDLYSALKPLFYDQRRLPKGKLMLSYRKEYHPDIDAGLSKFGLPKGKVYLTQLSKENIVEVVKGITLSEKLQERYRLQVEWRLPEIIADDLLEDRDSPVAPTLQILLTKMWEEAIVSEDPSFSTELYQSLKSQGLLMSDFFKGQMAIMEEKYPSEVASGLVLDVLYAHTTPSGTAATRQLNEVLSRYRQQEDVGNIIKTLSELFLLSTEGQQRYRLSHDTLARLVQQEFLASDKPGQRALRALENKHADLAKGHKVIIDSYDISLITRGLDGMRELREDEKEMLRRSEEEMEGRNIMQTRKGAIISELIGDRPDLHFMVEGLPNIDLSRPMRPDGSYADVPAEETPLSEAGSPENPS